MKPYFQNDHVTLYHADFRAVLPLLGRVDACITDPPYGETALKWDKWPQGWPALISPLTDCLWSFGSFRMFRDQRDDFSSWVFAQEIVWEKNAGCAPVADRFMRVHEFACHFYRGPWKSLRRAVPRVHGTPRSSVNRNSHDRVAHHGKRGPKDYVYTSTRLQRSVIKANNCRGYAVNETQKPEAVVAPLIEYSVPVGGVVLDIFAGSGTTLAVAQKLGRRAIGVEMRESQCEHIAKRISSLTLCPTDPPPH